MARLYADRVELMDHEGCARTADIEHITWDADAAEKGGYAHFMLKEIHEQPRAIRETIAGRISEIDGDVRLDLGMSDEEIQGLERVIIIACGTSYHAGLLARYLFPRAAGLPVDVEVASPSSRICPSGRRTLVVGITQSGETADTLLCPEEGQDLRRAQPGYYQRRRINGDGAGGWHHLYSLRAGDRCGCDQDLHISSGGDHSAGRTPGPGPRPSDAGSGQEDAH